jgi:hypothetical protein
MAAAVPREAALSFFGVGAPPHVPSWGNILSCVRKPLRDSRMLITRSVAVAAATIFGLVLGVVPASGDHGVGTPAREYVPRNDAEAAIVRLILTVAEGWERKDIERILSAYAPDAVQRAWNAPERMIDVAGIRAEAVGAFADPKLGTVRFDDWIHRIYVVNASALVEINQRFHGWGRDHYYRDFWMFARRGGRWWLIRYDYEPQPPFDRR